MKPPKSMIRLVVALLGLAGCSEERSIIVQVDGWIDSMQSLYVRTSLGDVLGSPFSVVKDQNRFVIKIPSDQSGWVVINTAGIAQDGEKVSVATASVYIDSETTFPASATLHICPLSQKTAASWVPYCNNATWTNLFSAFGFSPRDIYAVGWDSGPLQDEPGIIHWDGMAWKAGPQRILQAQERIWGSAANDIWMTSWFDDVAHWDGVKWTPMRPQASAGSSMITRDAYRGLWGSAADDVWIGSSSGPTLQWDGAKWNIMSKFSPNDMKSIWGYAGKYYGVSETQNIGKIFIFDRTNFSAQNLGTEKINSVLGSGTGNVWVLASGGIAYRMNGNSWVRIDTGLGANGNLIGGLAFSDSDVWITTSNGHIIHWDGNSFIDIPTATSDGLMALWGSNKYDLWAVGGRYRILRYIP